MMKLAIKCTLTWINLRYNEIGDEGGNNRKALKENVD